MKVKKVRGSISLLTAVLSITSFCAPTSYAGQERDGGNILKLRIRSLTDLIQGDLKGRLKILFGRIDLDKINDPTSRELISYMLGHEVLQDIDKSPYEIRPACIDKYGVSQAATAKENDLGGEICLNVKRLAKDGATVEELLGILVHEHAHHYGKEDSGHLIAEAAFFASNPDLADSSNGGSDDRSNLVGRDSYKGRLCKPGAAIEFESRPYQGDPAQRPVLNAYFPLEAGGAAVIGGLNDPASPIPIGEPVYCRSYEVPHAMVFLGRVNAILQDQSTGAHFGVILYERTAPMISWAPEGFPLPAVPINESLFKNELSQSTHYTDGRSNQLASYAYDWKDGHGSGLYLDYIPHVNDGTAVYYNFGETYELLYVGFVYKTQSESHKDGARVTRLQTFNPIPAMENAGISVKTASIRY